jgi:uncharacterized RDD family membrane protein YckC
VVGGRSADGPARPSSAPDWWWGLATRQPLFLALLALLGLTDLAALEASPMEGTPGKWLLGLRTTDLRGGRLSRGRATARWLVYAALAALLGPALLASLVARVVGLLFRAGGGMLVYALLFIPAEVYALVTVTVTVTVAVLAVLAWAPLVPVSFTVRRQAAHDLVARTVVVRGRAAAPAWVCLAAAVSAMLGAVVGSALVLPGAWG